MMQLTKVMNDCYQICLHFLQGRTLQNVRILIIFIQSPMGVACAQKVCVNISVKPLAYVTV